MMGVVAQDACRVRVRGGLRDGGGDETAHDLLGIVSFGGDGVERFDLGAHDGRQDLCDQFLFGGDVVIEAAREDAGPVADVAHSRRDDALLGEHFGGDLEDLAAAGRVGGARPGPRGGRSSHSHGERTYAVNDPRRTATFFTSQKKSKLQAPPSRPTPDLRLPPNGAARSRT